MSHPITILGAGGWIGSALVSGLHQRGQAVNAVKRNNLDKWLSQCDAQGPVIYAIGLTADFRTRPHETADAHVGLLSRVLQRSGIRQLLLLSSTRVYARSQTTNEADPLPCLSSEPSDLYNLSKLMGESLVLQDPRPGLKVARISNVIGTGQPASTFVGSLLEDASRHGRVTIKQPPTTEKDYVALDDVVRLLPLIATKGQQRIYNLGSGFNTTHSEVATWLEDQGCKVNFATQGETKVNFPVLTIDRLSTEFEPPGAVFVQNLLQTRRST